MFDDSMKIFVACAQLVVRKDIHSVSLKFYGVRCGDPFKTPPPFEEILPLPIPCFEMFLERSLNDPLIPLEAFFTATPSPSTTTYENFCCLC